MKISIDTNVYTEFFRGNEIVRNVVRKSQGLYLSAIVVGELLYGFRHGAKFEQNKKQLDAFLAEPYIFFLPVTMSTCERFGRIAAKLRKSGTPIPQNDIWIAAHAQETGTELFSFDSHFKLIGDLALVEFS